MARYILDFTSKDGIHNVTIEGEVIKVWEGEGLPKFETNDFDAFCMKYPYLVGEMVAKRAIKFCKA